jgi:putative DNA primase/helicase
LNKACSSVAKHPRTKHGHRDATTDPEQIAMWWNGKPLANVGVRTGGFLVVLDVDPRNGGDETLRRLLAEHGALPATWTVQTGGGGEHYYFAVDAELPTRAGLFPGVDLKGAGGFVVAPPSRHASGARYLWVRGRSLDDVQIARAPDWLLRHARSNGRSNGPGNGRPKTGDVAQLHVREGGRNNYLASFTGKLRRQGVDGSELVARVLDENLRRCAPPLSRAEVERVVGNIARYPAGSSDGIGGLLEATGAARLGKDAPAADREAVLRKLAELAPTLDRVKAALLRDELVRRRILSARVVDAVLRPVNGEAPAGLQGQAVVLGDAKPWDQPVDGAALLDEIAGAIRRHIVLPEQAAHAMALWILHSHALEPAQITPRLAILSPEKRCGKTTVLKVLGKLVRRPLSTTNVTAAALYRTIEKFQPTLLVDEADTFLREREELRGILNTGHDRAGAEVVRCCGDDSEPRRFATWAAVALAAIGEIHDTLADRSVVIRMKRRTPDESVAPLRRKHVAELDHLPRKCARWAADNNARLAGLEVEAPPELNDRAADNWEPLFGIADLAGGEWPSRARRAALALSVAPEDDDRTSRAQALLADVRGIFDRMRSDRLTTKELLRELVGLEGRPWADYGRGKGLSAHQLAAILRRFSIQTRNIRVAAGVVKGYFVEDFADAFARYLGPENRYTATPAEKPLDSYAAGGLAGEPVADPENELSEPNSAAEADLSRFPGIPFEDPRFDGDEYAILEPVDEDSPEVSTVTNPEPAELDPVEAGYLRAERLAIQEFGS